MVCYYLMLVVVYSKEDFEQNVVIVYDNWEVGNEIDMSEVPYICEILFRRNVLNI